MRPELKAQPPRGKFRVTPPGLRRWAALYPSLPPAWGLHPSKRGRCSQYFLFQSNKGNYSRINRYFFFFVSPTASYQGEYYPRFMSRCVFTVYGNVLKCLYSSTTLLTQCIVSWKPLLHEGQPRVEGERPSKCLVNTGKWETNSAVQSHHLASNTHWKKKKEFIPQRAEPGSLNREESRRW